MDNLCSDHIIITFKFTSVYYALQKLQVRLSTFTKSKIKDCERKKWEKVFIPDMMSSEESDQENDHNMVVRELPFRHERVTSYFHAIDEATYKTRSSQAVRQRKNRVLQGVSSRPIPSGVPKWSLKTGYQPQE